MQYDSLMGHHTEHLHGMYYYTLNNFGERQP